MNTPLEKVLQKLTIGIPVYNDKEFIEKTLDSCVHQAGHILIYDNSSNDGTSEICTEYARKFPHIHHVRHDKNIGAYENFKRLLFDCQTPYFQWLGSHDILGEGLTLQLLHALEADPSAAMAFGRITWIDEKGTVRKKKSKLRYTEKMLSDSPFERMKFLLSHLRDCFIIYGVFRTELAQKSWPDVPCIGTDDAMLLKAAALGKFIYVENVAFFARTFPVYRKDKDSRKRQSAVLLDKDGNSSPPTLNRMVSQMIETVTAMPQYADNLAQGFHVFDSIRKRYLEPREERRKRRNRILFGLLLLLLLGFLYWQFFHN